MKNVVHFKNTSRYVKSTKAQGTDKYVIIHDGFGQCNVPFRFFKEKAEKYL